MSLTSDLVGRTSRAGETLALIRNGSATTIAELAAAMGLARSTVAERVDLLVGRGLVSTELAPAQGRGRPASVFRFDPTARVALVAQVGMSGMRVGATDLAGGILHTLTADVAVDQGPRALVDGVQELFDACLARGISAVAYYAGTRTNTLMFKRYRAANRADHLTTLSAETWARMQQVAWTDEHRFCLACTKLTPRVGRQQAGLIFDVIQLTDPLQDLMRIAR